MRRAYLAEVVELAHLGSSGREWGLRLSDLAMDQIVDTIGYHLNPNLQASGINGSHHHPDHVHCEHGVDVPGHRSEDRSNSTGPWLRLLNVQSCLGHSLPGCIVTYPIASGKGKGRCWLDQESDGSEGSRTANCLLSKGYPQGVQTQGVQTQGVQTQGVMTQAAAKLLCS
jgi:hypothetical protein